MMRWLAPLLVLGACAPLEPQTATRDQLEFGQELSGRVAGKAASCISASTGIALHPVDNRTLTYRQGRTLWVNRLASECPGLRPLNRLVVEVHGSRYCRGNHVRSFEPHSNIPGPICILGDFTPYRER